MINIKNVLEEHRKKKYKQSIFPSDGSNKISKQCFDDVKQYYNISKQKTLFILLSKVVEND